MESSLKEEEDLSVVGTEIRKYCSDCKTSKTPLWRSGPTGPKSLCNACGIRYRKKRGGPSTTKSDSKKGKIGKTRNLMPLGQEVEAAAAKRSKRWSEVERAALLLMALSCGAVFG